MIIDEENYLAHIGVLHKSGRYPWGSGETQSARNAGFLDHVAMLKKQGMSEIDIAKGFDISTTELRAAKSIAVNEQRQLAIGQAQRLKDKGYGNVAIGKRMGINESSVRSLLAPGQKDKADVLMVTSGVLKDQVETHGYIDIGAGVEHHLGVSRNKMNNAVAVLQEDGYKVHYVKVPQLGTGKMTTQKVLSKPDVSYSEVYKNRDTIKVPFAYSEDNGHSFNVPKPPIQVSPDRVTVRYAKEGGADADGVIYVRPNVTDLSLGSARYAQVRVAVGGTHYLKGMAMYKDDLPDGVDLVFNTNKENTGNHLDAMKKLKDDPDNPFGAVVRQIQDIPGPRGKPTSAMNIVNEEGDWDNWSRSLSSQMLSKQSPKLAKTQLDMTYERKKNELDSILALSNPTVKKKLLASFADDADSSAVHLKAAALPRLASHVILPVQSLKDTEVYAPKYKDGEKVVLIRYPHGGTFEIPELTVNNKNAEAKRAFPNAKDAIGIHPRVAARLSGADFDGDSVLVIPNNRGEIKTSPALEGLKSFDPQHAYPAYEGMPTMSASTKGHEMGNVTNLIADMTIRGANATELAAAVRHSMVVIDAEKHNLNYKQSAKDNGIANLKRKYQSDPSRPNSSGASTLITRASSEKRVLDRKPRSAANGGPIDKATGKLVFENTNTTYTDKHGNIVVKTTKTTKLAETDDAFTLSSGTPIEKIYADHSNNLKALANQARLSMVNTKNLAYSPSAKTAYSNEVASLNSDLKVALRNAPLERQAQVIANSIVNMKKQANPDMDLAELKKVKSQALLDARSRTGAQKTRIAISDAQWNAIQAGAISSSLLEKVLNNSDVDRVKELATPRTAKLMSNVKQQRATQMLADGYTQAEVADHLGVSVSTLKSSLTSTVKG